MSDHAKDDDRKTFDHNFVYGTVEGDEIDGTFTHDIILGYDGDDEVRAGVWCRRR